MAKYRFKRKLYNALTDGVSTAAGSAIQTTGDIAKSGAGQLAGSVGGAMLGNAILPGIGGIIGGALAGKVVTGAVGQGLHNMGNDMKQ